MAGRCHPLHTTRAFWAGQSPHASYHLLSSAFIGLPRILLFHFLILKFNVAIQSFPASPRIHWNTGRLRSGQRSGCLRKSYLLLEGRDLMQKKLPAYMRIRYVHYTTPTCCLCSDSRYLGNLSCSKYVLIHIPRLHTSKLGTSRQTPSMSWHPNGPHVFIGSPQAPKRSQAILDLPFIGRKRDMV